MRCQETIQKYAKHQIKKSSQQWRLSEDWSFSRILRGWTSPHSAARSLGESLPKRKRQQMYCFPSVTRHHPLGLWEMSIRGGFFSSHLAGLCTAKNWWRGARCGKKKKPWPSRHGWQASYYKLASHKGDQGAWNPTTCEWLYRFWDCKRTGWSFTWLESQYDNESYGIWCMNQESPWKRVNHCPKGVS